MELHNYQHRAVEFMKSRDYSLLAIEMGLGKTVITLTAIKELMHERFEVHKVLVIAPLRVGLQTWPAEIEKWDIKYIVPQNPLNMKTDEL